MPIKDFGPRLRVLRKGRGERREDLAHVLGVGPSQISEMENGNKGTSMERLALICEHYNISADYLLGLTNEPRALK